MLLGLVLATSGTIEVLGHPMPSSARVVLPRVGALVEAPAAYDHLPGRANLALFDAMGPGGHRATRAGRIDDALDRVGLGGVDDRPVRAYSLGMRQRLGLAHALLRRPRLLVLDEPTNGLDPQGIREIRCLLLELNAAGATVFLSSHLLAEVEQLCTRVGVLDRGRLVVQDELAALRRPTGRVVVHTPDAAAAHALLDGRVERADPDRLLVRFHDPAALNAWLVGAGIRVESLVVERRGLEDVVLAATRPGSDRIGRP
jgi:ABC-2 type transport system ATP-binding protein